jgi:hypothetical protein
MEMNVPALDLEFLDLVSCLSSPMYLHKADPSPTGGHTVTGGAPVVLKT